MCFFESNDTWFESDLPDLYAPAPSVKPHKKQSYPIWHNELSAEAQDTFGLEL
jgi:hypothetical protein